MPAVQEEALVRVEAHGPKAKRLDHAIQDRAVLAAKRDHDTVEIRVFDALPEVRIRDPQICRAGEGAVRQVHGRARRRDDPAAGVLDSRFRPDILAWRAVIRQPRHDLNRRRIAVYGNGVRVNAGTAEIHHVDMHRIGHDQRYAAIDAAEHEEIAGQRQHVRRGRAGLRAAVVRLHDQQVDPGRTDRIGRIEPEPEKAPSCFPR